MPQSNPVIFLENYTPLDFLIESVSLTFTLSPNQTRVKSRVVFTANPAGKQRKTLRLDGKELKLISASIDGETLQLSPDAEGLDLPVDNIQKDQFVWECETEIDPKNNSSLDGLYMSNGMYCTQCEAEGFRKITFYPDRPDVMATFTVRIESDLPVLLSNGNPTAQGNGWAEWHDPWPKPSYLFALVAGDLAPYSDNFITMSGREVALNIYVRDGDQDKCAYAMDSLKRSMKWDEEAYGREYDLDLFNIVAVNDFNMGAMENKGLNIFNSILVLASPETAADKNFERIEAVIAHEYFHNWTGNRITCRDWFQLCLKEGLTVYRDQHFTSDMRDAAVKRIEDVITLRGRQFAEDAGGLAHPPRPNQYIEINNFYTTTVYEKGAEIVGMLRTLVGASDYRKALDLYFDRHDGQACTIEDWLKVFEDTTGRDLSQFKRWYTSAGTPRVTVSQEWDGNKFTLKLSQHTPETPNETEKLPRHIPIAVGLLSQDGHEILQTQILELTEAEQAFTFDNLESRPVASVLRGFSAPVILEQETDNKTRAFLLANDTDPFNRWEAGRAFALDILTDLCRGGVNVDTAFLDAIQTMVVDENLDPAFRALTLTLPSEEVIASHIHTMGGIPDPTLIHSSRNLLNNKLADHLAEILPGIYDAMQTPGPYSPDAEPAGKRALAAQILTLISCIDKGKTAEAQYRLASNMTDSLVALGQLISLGNGEEAIAEFYGKWKDDPIVLDKWFGIQASLTGPDRVLSVMHDLTQHEDFNWKNPNRFRSLMGAFAMNNPAGFHHPSGDGYKLVAEWLIKLDPHNPQIAARVCTVFESWRRYGPERQAQMKSALENILAAPKLSKNTSEIAGKILGA